MNTLRRVVGLLAILFSGVPQLRAQGRSIQVGGELGAVVIHEGYCGGHGTGLIFGFSARSRGPVVVSTGADLILSGLIISNEEACALGVGEYQGRQVEVWGSTRYDRGMRLKVGLGYLISVGSSVSVEFAAMAGVIPTKTNYGSTQSEPRVAREASTLQPWYTGTVRVESSAYPIGLKLELGRNRTPRRLYDDDLVVLERHTWHKFGVIALTVPLLN